MIDPNLADVIVACLISIGLMLKKGIDNAT